MAARLELLKEQFFDDDGAVLAGGLLYTYVVGTTTEKATYTTVLGDVEQANPVVLDSSGRVATDLYGVGAYKIVIKDSAGTTIDTIPSVSGINSASMTTIGDYSGDFDAAITAIGATATTLYIDDTATMSAAVTVPATCTVILEKGGTIVQDGNALTFNGPLIVHGGTITNNAALTINGHFTDTIFQVFTSTGTVTFGSSSIGFRRPEWFYSGSGLYTTAFERAIVSNSVVELVGGKTYSMSPDGITNATRITGKNTWTINGNGAILKFDDDVENGAILFIDDCDYFRIRDVEFDGNISGGSVGHRKALAIVNISPADVATGSCDHFWLDNLYIHDTLSGAIAYDASGIQLLAANDGHVNACNINNTDVGIYVRQSNRITITNNYIGSGVTSEAISLWGDDDVVTNSDITITGNVLKRQLQLAFVDGCSVSGNMIKQMAIGGGTSDSNDYIAKNVNVTGNTITYRIKLGEQNGSQTTTTALDILISGNNFDMDDDFGVRTEYEVSGLSILNNYFKLENNATAIISLTTTGDTPPANVSVKGNHLDMNGYTLGYFLVTTATVLRIQNNNCEGAPSSGGITVDTAAGDMGDVIITGNIIPDGGIYCSTGQPYLLKNNITNGTSYDVASAGSLTLYAAFGADDGYFNITGTTDITSITATRPGHVVTLRFGGILTMTDGSNLKLAGNFITSAGDTMQLICDGTNWHEVSRSDND